MTHALENYNGTISTVGRRITNLRFAYDIDGITGEENEPAKLRSDVQMALLVLRETLIDSHLFSPAELLYGRRVVSNLPVATWNAIGERCEIPVRLDQRQALLKNAMTLVVSQTWQNCYEDNTFVRAPPGHSAMGTWPYS